MLDGLDSDGIIALTTVAALIVAMAITVILVILNR